MHAVGVGRILILLKKKGSKQKVPSGVISRAFGMFIFFPSPRFFPGRMKVHWCKAGLLDSFQAQTIFISASLQMH